MRHSSLGVHLNDKLEVSKIRVQCSRSIRLDYFLASSILSPAAYMLSDWKTQYRSRCWKRKLELGDIMTELPLLNKFKFPEVLRVQATPGFPAAEEEVGGAGGHGDDGDRDGHRGLQPLPLQELHAPRAPPVGGFAAGRARRGEIRGRGLVWFGRLVWCGQVRSQMRSMAA
jgi:hypothetical protein